MEPHPNIVTYYDSWLEADPATGGDHFYIKLELCGEALRPPVHAGAQPAKAPEVQELLKQVRRVDVLWDEGGGSGRGVGGRLAQVGVVDAGWEGGGGVHYVEGGCRRGGASKTR